MKKVLEFLSKGVSPYDHRPALTFGHIQIIDDVPVAVAANGYSIHAVWGVRHISNPFPLGNHSMDFALREDLNELPNMPDVQGIIPRPESLDVTVSINDDAFMAALKASKKEHSMLLLIDNQQVYLATHNALYRIKPLVLECPHKQAWLSFDPKLMLNALPYVKSEIRWQQGSKSAFLVGEHGDMAAAIMPMSGGSFRGFMVDWFNLPERNEQAKEF